MKPNYSKMHPNELKQIVTADNELGFAITENMLTYGGSFVQSLAECYRRADYENKHKLVKAFYNYFVDYCPENWEKHGQTTN